jgi:small subunit ribosomal protein S6
MSSEPTLYDLVLMLSTTSEDEARAKVLADVEAAIAAAGGSIERNQDWGRRPTAYKINHQAEADYRLLQFMGPTSLLETLKHNLSISDDVVRYRIIKVVRGTPPASDEAPPILAGGPVGVGSDDED